MRDQVVVWQAHTPATVGTLQKDQKCLSNQQQHPRMHQLAQQAPVRRVLHADSRNAARHRLAALLICQPGAPAQGQLVVASQPCSQLRQAVLYEVAQLAAEGALVVLCLAAAAAATAAAAGPGAAAAAIGVNVNIHIQGGVAALGVPFVACLHRGGGG